MKPHILSTFPLILLVFLAGCHARREIVTEETSSPLGEAVTDMMEGNVGNQTFLYLGGCGEFEANNILPVTWLSLFTSEEFIIETRTQDGEEFEVAVYQTSIEAALERIRQVRVHIEDKTPIWIYLRPIVVLHDILAQCPSDEIIELDLSQFWDKDQIYRERVVESPTRFTDLLASVTGQEEDDLARLNQLVNYLSLNHISSVTELNSEDKMFVLIGTYWGDKELEELYSFEYFDDAYWNRE